MMNWKQLRKSFLFAGRGLMIAWKEEQNFRIQICVAFFVIFFMFVFRVSRQESVILVFVIFSVLVLELLNSIFERFLDLLKPRLHRYVEVIKDAMAAAVLLAACGSLIIGALIFWPYIKDFF